MPTGQAVSSYRQRRTRLTTRQHCSPSLVWKPLNRRGQSGGKMGRGDDSRENDTGDDGQALAPDEAIVAVVAAGLGVFGVLVHGHFSSSSLLLFFVFISL